MPNKSTPTLKYIFVTGGVVSSLGKGLCAASLGTLLEHRGLNVVLQKFDPYLNVDPGTMNPFEHGEVYVLEDGAETDLDLGHYERFTNCRLSKANSTSSGQIFEQVLKNERKGEYLGKTVQVIPHVTNEIKARIQRGARKDTHVVITEIGGTVGDIEGLPFLEAIRQFIDDVGQENAIVMHVTLIPFIKAAGELKTKPSQQSVAKLREIGLQPTILIARTDRALDPDIKGKLSQFCSVAKDAVIECRDAKSIYQVPLLLQAEKLDDVVCRVLGLDVPPADLAKWRGFVDRLLKPTRTVKVALVGKYTEHKDAYKSIAESLTHASADAGCKLDLQELDAEEVTPEVLQEKLAGFHGILVPGGFGERGIEGKILAAKFARETGTPYLGLCLGMQIATIEFARHVCGYKDANSEEMNPQTPHPVIHLMPDQRDVKSKGASMRLGTWDCKLTSGTKARALYNADMITERHRHRYEFNNEYRAAMEKKGFIIAGTSPDGRLVELIELKNHPWFLACQYHPEFQSKPNHPNPLFLGFIQACSARLDK